MLKRTVTAVFIVIGLVIVAYFSATPVLPVTVAAFSVIAVLEMGRCTGSIKNLWTFVPSVVAAVAMPLCARLFESVYICLIAYLSAFYLMLVYFLVCAVFSKNSFDPADATLSFGTTFYIVFGFTSIVLLRDVKFGQYICLLAVGAPWISDVFAYLCGRFFGKHKLIPNVSPKKTVEGSIGGIIFCSALCAVYGFLVFRMFRDDFTDVNYLFFIIAGVVISVVSQIGDLIASVIKRKYNLKDYGRIFPGHGGVLDRFDSILPTAPFILLLVILPLGFEMFI